MIIQYDNEGKIYQLIFEPIQEGVLDSILARGVLAINVKTDIRPIIILNEYYIENEQLCKRPVMPVTISKTEIIANDQDVSVVNGIIKGSCLNIDEQIISLDEEFLEITSNVPHLYELRIEKWPFMPWIEKVSAK